ncbi:ribonuclease HII [Candidatus Berkelbacteria bacterium]|nr:ribonuclease HII [Candidatus Berkelbacteria bacterium]
MKSTKPHFRYEHQCSAQGYQLIAGMDEVGRGAWAGPLVAAVYIHNLHHLTFNVKTRRLRFLAGVRDSKQLSRAERERLVPLIKAAGEWGVGEVSPREIDRLGLTRAQNLAYERTVSALPTKPEIILLDGKLYRNYPTSLLGIPVKYILKGDSHSYSIAAASIIAKVHRDELMRGQHLAKRYGFDSNVGYGTPLHQAKIREYGLSRLHRKSYIQSSG